ncbi:hypothetical protein BC833DRAFT_575333 [Globomyces pollinis-pini]|nr:hypothetical protein BC833DRAFT_575333 [Globomyces pollinis-pini]
MLPQIELTFKNRLSTPVNGERQPDYEIIGPPDCNGFTTTMTMKKLKLYSDQLFEKNKQLVQDAMSKDSLLAKLKSENEHLSSSIAKNISTIAELRIANSSNTRFDRSQEECERILLKETKMRQQLQAETAQQKQQLSSIREEFEAFKLSASKEDHLLQVKEEQIIALTTELQNERQSVDDKLFKVDELKVEIIKLHRIVDNLQRNNNELLQKTQQLTESGTTLGQENEQLQKRIRELIDANKDVTVNYQIVKKNFDIKKHENEELTLELDEAKNACQLSIKQKKGLQADLAALQKAKDDLKEQLISCEANVVRKDEEIAQLLKKISEIIEDYEEKLERKDEQIWGMNAQLNEEVQKSEKQRAAALSASKKKDEANLRSTVDAELISDIERKWQRKEKSLLQELDSSNFIIREKQKQIIVLSDRIAELEKDQYHPRMIYLKKIENEMKNKLIEYNLSEERLETGFICPRSLDLFHQPVTLSPCGHTYCAECVDLMKNENFNVLKCDTCHTVATATFKNDQIKSVQEQFIRHRQVTGSFNVWIQELQKYHPDDKLLESNS